MDQPQKRGRGRPPKPPGELKRAPFSARLRDSLRARLEEEAAKRGYSLSEEIEARLEASFISIESRFGGRAGLEAATMLTASFLYVGGAYARAKGIPDGPDEWLKDPEIFERALATLVRSTWEYHPGSATGQDLIKWLETLYRHVLGTEIRKEQERKEAAAAVKPAADEAA